MVVLAPERTSERKIESILKEHQSWITKQLLKWETQAADLKTKVFEPGGEFLYLGQVYRLNVVAGVSGKVLIEGQSIALQTHTVSEPVIKLRLFQWYVSQARLILPAKTIETAQKLGKQPKKIEMGQFKSLWGSCSRDGRIKYNWQLMQAPEPVIDYIVAHEVSHLCHMDHSAEFWATVESLQPDYKTHRKWLKDNAYRLSWP